MQLSINKSVLSSVEEGQSVLEKSLMVSGEVFDAKFNRDLVHQVVTAYRACARSATKAQKNRAQVRGGGAKPWRQKGTGRARAGSASSPIWRSGGMAFATSYRNFYQKINRKMYIRAMRSIFSELVRKDRLIVLDDLSVDQPKTRVLVSLLQSLKIGNALVIHDNIDENLWLAARNLYQIALCEPVDVTPYYLLKFPQIVATVAALKKIEERLK